MQTSSLHRCYMCVLSLKQCIAYPSQDYGASSLELLSSVCHMQPSVPLLKHEYGMKGGGNGFESTPLHHVSASSQAMSDLQLNEIPNTQPGSSGTAVVYVDLPSSELQSCSVGDSALSQPSLPGSIVDNAQTPELKIYLAGQVWFISCAQQIYSEIGMGACCDISPLLLSSLFLSLSLSLPPSLPPSLYPTLFPRRPTLLSSPTPKTTRAMFIHLLVHSQFPLRPTLPRSVSR